MVAGRFSRVANNQLLHKDYSAVRLELINGYAWPKIKFFRFSLNFAYKCVLIKNSCEQCKKQVFFELLSRVRYSGGWSYISADGRAATRSCRRARLPTTTRRHGNAVRHVVVYAAR